MKVKFISMNSNTNFLNVLDICIQNLHRYTYFYNCLQAMCAYWPRVASCRDSHLAVPYGRGLFGNPRHGDESDDVWVWFSKKKKNTQGHSHDMMVIYICPWKETGNELNCFCFVPKSRDSHCFTILHQASFYCKWWTCSS